MWKHAAHNPSIWRSSAIALKLSPANTRSRSRRHRDTLSNILLDAGCELGALCVNAVIWSVSSRHDSGGDSWPLAA